MLKNDRTVRNCLTYNLGIPLANNLINQQSLYLRQHAHNPINWYPWGKEALDCARRENKPIFLSIGYSSCHWCHVMEKEVFEQVDVAALLNEKFICIKVDREEQPDIDAIYMEAVQAMTGRGGWPLSVFLTPDLKPFFGGTYFPHGHFIELARTIASLFSSERQQIENYAEELAKLISSNPAFEKRSSVKQSDIERIVADIVRHIDTEWGGFREEMKFPQPVKWRFLLHYYRKTGQQQLGEMIKKTLNNIAMGGIYDQIGGGFHRYTTDRIWFVPHFEKMLYDNAQMASLYIEAWTVFKDELYNRVARQTLDFLVGEFSGDEGAFYSSLDADSDGREGSFYLWRYDEFLRILGPENGVIVAMLFGATPQGNFEGQNILTRRVRLDELAATLKKGEAEIKEIVENSIPKLRAFRANRVLPQLDKKIIVSWNGLAISALVQGFCAFGERKYLKKGEMAADYLLKNHKRADGGLWRSSYAGKAENPAVLDDYGNLARSLLELFEVTGDVSYWQQAIDIIEYVSENFRSPDGCFYLTEKSNHVPLGRKIDYWDGVMLSGNAALLGAIAKAAILSSNKRFYDVIEDSLSAASNMILRAGIEMTGWLDTALLVNAPHYAVVICGEADNPNTKRLIESFREAAFPHASSIVVPNKMIEEKIATFIPIVSGKSRSDQQPIAYVCEKGRCLEPTSKPEVMIDQLKQGWKY